jgi:hypothetical protein
MHFATKQSKETNVLLRQRYFRSVKAKNYFTLVVSFLSFRLLSIKVYFGFLNDFIFICLPIQMSTTVLQTSHNYHSLQHNAVKCIFSAIIQSRWPRGLGRVSATMHLLRLWVQIPPEAWRSVCCKCCMLSGGNLCEGLITCPWSPTICGVSLSVIYEPHEWGGHSLRSAAAPWGGLFIVSSHAIMLDLLLLMLSSLRE